MATESKHSLPSETFSGVAGWNFWTGLAGVGFTFAVAVLGYELAKVPGFGQVGPLACAIIIAVFYRQLFGYPEQLRAGIQFSSGKLLRLAIILFGLKLNIAVILSQGAGLLVYGAFTIVFSIGLTLVFAKMFKADPSLSLILGIGTGVCGAAAIAAVSPILRTREEDTAMGVGIIALVGTLFSIGYTVLRPLVGLTDAQYGIWAGISLHEIAHVALAAAPAGQEGLAMGLLAKLGRVLLLVPLSFVLMYVRQRSGKDRSGAKVAFPWFLGGFVLMSLFGSYVLGKYLVVSQGIMEQVGNTTSLLLTMAMVGLGLNVSLHELRTKALRPLAAMLLTSVILAAAMFALV